MPKLYGFIITKDRPVQLKALLDSLELNAPRLCDEICILHASSDRYYQAAYYKVMDTCNLPILNFPELDYLNFNNAMIGVLDNIGKDNYVLGLTDDTLFYRPLKSPYGTGSFIQQFENPQLFTLSLRLGQNTIYQNPENHNDLIKIPADYINGFATWNWTRGTGDHNEWYPISLDGHMYRSDDLLELCKTIKFRNLREWEGELIAHVRHLDNKWKMTKFGIACPQHSFCVNVPLNMIQYPFYKTFGPYGVSAPELLETYNNGYKLDIVKMLENIEINGSHQYIKPIYVYMNQ